MRPFVLLLFSAGLVLAARPTAVGRSKPNVLLILADDLGFEGLGCYGGASYQTPHLDRLAKEGARFDYCYSQPLCTPTRVQIMTGRYYFRNYTQFGELKKGERTFGHMMQQAGYRTAVAGKWQLDGDGDGAGQTPAEAGFDEYCLWNVQVGERKTTRTRYADASLMHFNRRTKQPEVREYKPHYGPDVCARYLMDFMENSVLEGGPFFAYYPMILTHNPFKPTPNSDVWKDGNRHQQDKRFFKDMVEYMDVIVGRMVEHLEKIGARKNTLIIFTGDNGTPGGLQTRMRDGRTIIAGKGLPRDSGTHVPLLVNWPGRIAGGQVSRHLVDMSDFLPTIADASGATPRDVSGDWIIDGRSFLPPLLGMKGTPRTHVVVDYREPRQDKFGWPKARFVRDHRYKLYGFYELTPKKKSNPVVIKTGLLYDTVKDIEEERPLDPAKDDEKLKAIRARLAVALAALPAIE